uniref:Uncharacterized protein n=1 Tax=Anguilla anguilla TaxID=7936 RepID=A0A0E9VMS3_ANGAN
MHYEMFFNSFQVLSRTHLTVWG